MEQTALQAYKKAHNLDLSAFADPLKITKAHASRLIAGKLRSINVAYVHTIFDLTNGEIDANAIFGIEPKNKSVSCHAPIKANDKAARHYKAEGGLE